MTFKPWRIAAATLCALAMGAASAQAAKFEAGAGRADITPPPYTTESDAAFVPTCGITPAQVKELWPGPRDFAFEKPYRDTYGLGKYAPGDPYCESDGTHRYEAPYIAGGNGQNHWPTSVDPGNGPEARVVVFAVGSSRVALVSIDSIGMFNVTMNRIRAEVKKLDPDIGDVFISSTHDESAPDPVGLWGPDTSELPEHPESPTATSSGVDEYYFDFLVERVAHAVASADAALKPATLDVATGSMPSNTQSCWSSYPFIDDQSLPVMQARAKGGNVIFTLADVGTHAETLAFSGSKADSEILSADWPGAMRAALEARWPGSVGIELAGMVGSVETPTVYEPESTQVLRTPVPLHHVPGNPDDCRSVYPEPATGTPVDEAHEFIKDYGQSVADTVAAALEGGHKITPRALKPQQESLCVALENNYFAAAYAAGLFPDRPGYSNSECTIEAPNPGAGASTGSTAAAAPSPSRAASASSAPSTSEQLYLKTNVGVLTLGSIQLAYSPGEVFPFTEIGGPIDEAQMPFPTNCYESTTENFYCGSPLPMTPYIAAEMTTKRSTPYRFLVGLGEDMIGYLMPPGNFVGNEATVDSEPWASYEDTKKTSSDRFGYGHSDDTESVGPYGALSVTTVLQSLLRADGRGLRVVPGLFVDAEGHFSDSPFASTGFSGAVGIEVRYKHKLRKLLIGHQAKGFATFDGRPDPGTAGTSLPYSVSSRGVILRSGKPLEMDVYAGAKEPGL